MLLLITLSKIKKRVIKSSLILTRITMNKFYFGAHNRTSDDMLNGIKEIKEAGGNIVQIFLVPPGSKKVEDRTNTELDEVKKYIKLHQMKLVVHSSYLHNLARNWDTYSWWLKNLELEIINAHKIGAFGLVLHFGKRLDLSTEEAYNNMYSSLIFVLNKTKEFKDVKIFLETPTGQGTEICYKIEDLAHFYKKFSKNPNPEIKERVRLCIDTCHIFSAGYNIVTKNEVKLYLETFEELIGIRYIGLIHLNDSRVEVGAQVDRHENIDKGYIGINGLKAFFNYFRKLKIPIVLETPNNGFEWEIKLLKNYVYDI
jgi:deoxyribonuclease IV